MPVTQINRANCKVLREDLNKAIGEILTKHGLVGSIGRITFEPGMELRTKLTVTQPAVPVGLPPQKPKVGEVWMFGNKRYTITQVGLLETLAQRPVRGIPRTYRIPPKMMHAGIRVK